MTRSKCGIKALMSKAVLSIHPHTQLLGIMKPVGEYHVLHYARLQNIFALKEKNARGGTD